MPSQLDDAYIKVPCGKCAECRRARGLEWQIRLVSEMRGVTTTSLISYFVTLTLSPSHYARFATNPARAIRLFLERYRKRYKQSCRHWIVTELGETNDRLHFHGLLFSSYPLDAKILSDLWQYGFVYVGRYSDVKSAKYVTKYITKLDMKHPDFEPSVFASPGIGKSFVEQYGEFVKACQNYVYRDPINGTLSRLPRYYKTKIFSPEEIKKHSQEVKEKGPIITWKGMKFSCPSAWLSFAKKQNEIFEDLGLSKSDNSELFELFKQKIFIYAKTSKGAY